MSIWHSFPQANCLPDNCGCELVRDALIRQPSAFWSSFVYILLGLWFYREMKVKSFRLRLWVIGIVLLGISSLFGHMSFIQLAMSMDFASIIVLISFFALFNLCVLLKQSRTRILFFFFTYYVVLLFIMYQMNKWAKVSVCVLIFIFAMGDLVRSMGWAFLKARLLQYSVLVLICSFILFMLDELKIVCDPVSHYQLHSMWHLGTAVSLFLYGKWYFTENRS